MGVRKKTLRAIKLRKQIKAFIGVFRDPRTPLLGKIFLGAAVGYMLLPFDIIPDFIPFVGLIDDVIIVPILFYLAFLTIPKELIQEHIDKTKQN